MNAGIQLLLSSVNFREYILSSECNGTMFTELKNLYQQQNKNKNYICPSQFRYHFGCRHPPFSTFQQQDSAEMLLLLIDDLELEEKQFYKCKEAPLSKFLYTPIIKTFICQECQKQHSNIENSESLILEISKQIEQKSFWQKAQNLSDLKQCMEYLFEEEYYDIKCENCKQITTHVCKKEFGDNPSKQVFIILKRFGSDGTKLGHSVQFSNTITIQSHQYKLDGVVLHSGFLGGGHYTAYHIVDKKQYLCNDSSVSQSKIDYKTSAAYVFSYHRLD